MSKLIKLIHVEIDHVLALDSNGCIWDGWYDEDPDHPETFDWTPLNDPWVDLDND